MSANPLTSPSDVHRRPSAAARRFDRAGWLTLALSIFWMVATPALMLFNFNYPSDGWTNYKVQGDGGFLVTMNVTGQPSALQEGDRVIAINGEPYREDPFPHLPPNLQYGQVLQYTIVRGGQTLTVEVPLVHRDALALWRYFVLAWQQNFRGNLIALLSILIAAFAFFARPRSRPAQLLLLIFSFYCAAQWFGFADWHPYVGAYPFPLALGNIFFTYSWAWYFFPTWILLALSFPVVKWPLRRWPRALPAMMYGLPTVLSFISVWFLFATRAMVWRNFQVGLLLGSALLFGVALFASLLHNWLTLRAPVARAQLLWITLGVGLGWGGLIALTFLDFALGNSSFHAFTTAFSAWLGLLLPVSLAVAITRYRLFDIELLIRRTLIYGVLTALLALVYFGAVVLLQQLFRGLTEQGGDLAIIVSTLAIAALSVPLRNRVQQAIDRRFYRRKYNAAHVLESFAGTVRDEVDLHKLTENLMGVVEETMQPESVSVWVRAADDDRRMKMGDRRRETDGGRRRGEA